MQITDRSQVVYQVIADEALEAFSSRKLVAKHRSALLGLYRLLDRFRYDSFTVSNPPGVLERVGRRDQENRELRRFELKDVRSALDQAYSTVYGDKPREKTIDRLQEITGRMAEKGGLTSGMTKDARLVKVFLKEFRNHLAR